MSDDVAAVEIIERYERLVEKANKAASYREYHGLDKEDQARARLTIDGDTAILTYPRATTDYDSAVLEDEEERVPAWLLSATDEQIAQWQADRRAADEAKSEALRQDNLVRWEAEERAAYEALKKKYG